MCKDSWCESTKRRGLWPRNKSVTFRRLTWTSPFDMIFVLYNNTETLWVPRVRTNILESSCSWRSCEGIAQPACYRYAWVQRYMVDTNRFLLPEFQNVLTMFWIPEEFYCHVYEKAWKWINPAGSPAHRRQYPIGPWIIWKNPMRTY